MTQPNGDWRQSPRTLVLSLVAVAVVAVILVATADHNPIARLSQWVGSLLD